VLLLFLLINFFFVLNFLVLPILLGFTVLIPRIQRAS
jgi:hypothetical protein